MKFYSNSLVLFIFVAFLQYTNKIHERKKNISNVVTAKTKSFVEFFYVILELHLFQNEKNNIIFSIQDAQQFWMQFFVQFYITNNM